MSGVFVTPMPEGPAPRPVEKPATLGEVWDANRVLARGDRTDAEAERLRKAYEPLLDPINRDRAARGLKPLVNPGYWQSPLERRPSADNGPFDFGSILDPRISRDEQEAEIFREIGRIRQRNPGFLRQVKGDVSMFRRSIIDQEMAARGEARDVLSRSSGLTNTVGGFAAGAYETMHDPVNIASLPLGGGGKTIFAQVARSALINGGLEALQLPTVAHNREQLGEELTAGEALQQVGFAAVGGVVGDVVIPHAGSLAIKGAKKAIDAAAPTLRPGLALRAADIAKASDGDVASVFSAAMPAEMRTADESAALHVINREAEVRGSSPYGDSPAGLDAHASRLQASMEAILRANSGDAAASAVIAPNAPIAPRPSLNLPGDVVSFFRGKGYSDAQARGIAAGIVAESGGSHGALNPTSGAFGIGQWLGARKDELFRRYGPNPTRAEQLEFLHWELQGGDHGGAHVLAQTSEAGVLDVYVRRFMRPGAGAETNGDLARGMAALGRPVDDLADAADLSADAAVLRPAALDAVRPTIETGPLAVAQFRPGEIGVDAGLMQFKEGGDQFGVTDRLRGVSEWDPLSAGTVTVWEATDGRRLIADGHQRLGLAKRILADNPNADIRMNAFVLREADGITAEKARLVTALKNIGEGTGTPTDAAKIFREGGEAAMGALARRLPPRSPLVRDGKALAALSPDAFGAVINDVIPEGWGASIGALASDKTTHIGLVNLLARLQPANRRQAEGIVSQALDAGFTRESQAELFGGRDLVSSLFLDRARVLDRGLAELKKLKAVFRTAADNADTLESAGSSIAVEASSREAADNARALAIIERLALRKGNDVNATLNDAAKRLAAGERIGSVVRDFVAAVRGLDLNALERGAGSGDLAGVAADGSGRGLLAGGGDEPPHPSELNPATRDELEAAGQGGFDMFGDSPVLKAFADPAGDGAKLQADSLAHDVRAELDMFGGPTAADKRGALERAGVGRSQADVAQKPPGSDGGLFDVQAQDLAFRLDAGEERTAADILSEIDADAAAIDTVRGCL